MSVTVDHLLTIRCELLQRAYDEAADEQGEQPVSETVVAGAMCELQQSGSREEAGGAVQVTTYRLFLADGTPLRGWDAIRLEDGTVLELEGDAARAVSPLTGVGHVEAVAHRVDYGEASP